MVVDMLTSLLFYHRPPTPTPTPLPPFFDQQ
jgi:hypothetical protein